MGRTVGGQQTMNYEKVKVDEWLAGAIEEVQYQADKKYKSKDKDTGEWSEKTAPHVRLKFKLDGYQYPHYSRWMKASTNEKSNFYAKYLKHLCPDFDCRDKVVDIDKLVGFRVRTMWENDGEYQNITSIRPSVPNLNIISSMGGAQPGDGGDAGQEDDGGDVPF